MPDSPAWLDDRAAAGAADASLHPALLLGACQYPGGLLDASRIVRAGALTAASNLPGPADQALRRLAAERRQLREQGYQTPLLLAGDEIYADATAGLWDDSSPDATFRRSWNTRHANPWLRMASGEGPVIAVLDDHEITDNWEPGFHAERNAELHQLMQQGRGRFIERMRGGQAHPGADPGATRLWYEDRVDGHLLFVGDARTEREPRDVAHIDQACILGKPQMAALQAALLRAQQLTPQAFKLVATSSILLPRRLFLADAPAETALRSDSWTGYPGSLHRILALIHQHKIRKCVFVSGDEHLPIVAQIRVQRLNEPGQPAASVTDPGITLLSVHAGALYAPYPFANSQPTSFAGVQALDDAGHMTDPADPPDQFDFTITDERPRHYRCTTRAWLPANWHQGFVRLDLPSAVSRSAGLQICLLHAVNPALDLRFQIDLDRDDADLFFAQQQMNPIATR